MSTAKDQRGFSAGPWPIDGGCEGSETCAYSELVITGHADGSIRFWDSSSTVMQCLYRIVSDLFFCTGNGNSRFSLFIYNFFRQITRHFS